MAVLVVPDAVKQIAASDLSGSVFAVEGAAHPYRLLVESMQQGAAVVGRDGLVIYCNPYLAGLICLALCLTCSPRSTARWTVRRRHRWVASGGIEQGSIFSVILPTVPSLAPDLQTLLAPPAEAAEVTGAAEARPVCHRILVVDDNFDAAQTMIMLLGL